jgi:hypothetical protein
MPLKADSCAGPNHGRKFYLCSRPVGPGYEREGRERIDINPECEHAGFIEVTGCADMAACRPLRLLQVGL